MTINLNCTFDNEILNPKNDSNLLAAIVSKSDNESSLFPCTCAIIGCGKKYSYANKVAAKLILSGLFEDCFLSTEETNQNPEFCAVRLLLIDYYFFIFLFIRVHIKILYNYFAYIFSLMF